MNTIDGAGGRTDHHWVLRIFACWVLLAVACGEERLGPTDQGAIPIGDDSGISGGCAVDDDCPFGEICSDGACTANTSNPTDRGCRSDTDCPENYVCALASGRCVEEASHPDPPPVGTSSCAEGEVRRCGSKVGACAYGTEGCADGIWSGLCEGEVGPSDEICNRIDDDCNAETDEGFLLGEPCSAGLGACEESGVTICAPAGDVTTCSVSGLDPAGRVEQCGNTIDDDCDGEADEDFILGAACTAGFGVCERSGVVVCSADLLSVECGATPGTPGPNELCGNAADDDCDGTSDEGFVTGAACTVGVGACSRSGTVVCAADQLSVRCSANAAPPGTELCGNNIDDDCDNQTDEGFPNRGTTCAIGTPPCQTMGTWQCNAASTGLDCVLPPASAELCNGTDDDNDTCVDEDFNVGQACSAGAGVCLRSGSYVCNGPGTATLCNATPGSGGTELCGNSLDDDCDNQTDEGFPNLGTACTQGQGICLRNGSFVCNASRLGTVCGAVAGSPNPSGELCGNGLDDDCDNQTDEGFPVGQACTVGQGICQRSGSRVCTANGLSTQCNVSPGAPNPNGELCGNGLDDDCDGVTDEGFPVGQACTVGLGICQRSGTRVCTANGLSTQCNASPGAPNLSGELCGNSLDDDCDGFTDEGYPNLGNACTAGTGACARNGTYVCTANRLATTCSASPGTPVAENCNNVDDDCNGTADNGCDDDDDDYCDTNLVIAGSPLVCPLTNSAATEDCNDAVTAINPGATEICNDAVDQNCDGNNNDGCAMCNPAVDADFDGSNACLDCDETNGAVRPGATERCDGIDNDCDGLRDEGFDADNDGYTTCGTDSSGGLSPAFVDCNDNNNTVYPTACELCATAAGTVACGATNDRGNSIDEDCDGYVDETCSPCSTADPDGDGYSDCEGDCLPNNGSVSPGMAEQCDGLDTDCNANTTENCQVGDSCNWPGTPPPDACAADLICVESLGPGGNPTGNFTCTSFCNFSYAGLGVGDGCAANQACNARLTPTANLHGCSVTTDIGLSAVGAACSADANCRTSQCLRDQRVAGPPVEYCSDLCGSNAYCSGGTTCQVWGGDTGRCWTTLSIQNRGVGVACNDTNTRCLAGPRACVQLAVGNRICSAVCCTDSNCPAAYHCSPNGNDSPGPVGGYDTVPICWPDATGAHNRVAGQACTSSGQCVSEFCDTNLGVCVDICCNDSNCPTGLTCEQATIQRPDGHQTFGRVCVNLTPSSPLVAGP